MDSSKPQVSVVIPTYNRNGYLRRAIRSVVNQTYEPIELVVIDDNSPVSAEEVLSEVNLNSIAHVKYIRHEENRGANAARNTGIELATGELIAFLDDDDWWAQEKLERQVDVFKSSDSPTGVVYTGIRYVNPKGEEVLVSTPIHRGWVTEAILTGGRFQEFSAVMVDSTLIKKAGFPDERFPSWQDREWYLRLSVHGTFEPISEPLTVRRMDHGGQIKDNYEEKRDVSYPLFIEEHRSLAAEYGWLTERQFIAAISASLAKAALKNGHYGDARRYFIKSMIYYPGSLDVCTHLLASLGGKYTYGLAQKFINIVRSIKRRIGAWT